MSIEPCACSACRNAALKIIENYYAQRHNYTTAEYFPEYDAWVAYRKTLKANGEEE